MKFGWRGALGIVLSAAALWWTLHDVDLRAVWQVIAGSNAWWGAARVRRPRFRPGHTVYASEAT